MEPRLVVRKGVARLAVKSHHTLGFSSPCPWTCLLDVAISFPSFLLALFRSNYNVLEYRLTNFLYMASQCHEFHSDRVIRLLVLRTSTLLTWQWSQTHAHNRHFWRPIPIHSDSAVYSDNQNWQTCFLRFFLSTELGSLSSTKSASSSCSNETDLSTCWGVSLDSGWLANVLMVATTMGVFNGLWWVCVCVWQLQPPTSEWRKALTFIATPRTLGQLFLMTLYLWYARPAFKSGLSILPPPATTPTTARHVAEIVWVWQQRATQHISQKSLL